MAKKKYLLRHTRSPGDVAVMTALARDIHLTYPGEFELSVDTNAKDIWLHNPHVVPNDGHQRLHLDYGEGISKQKFEPVHFVAYFHRDFEKKTGIKVPCHLPHGDIHLSEEEKTGPLVSGRYWVVISGGKSDVTVKVWDQKRFQSVVEQLMGMGAGIVQAGATSKGHWHPSLQGALDLVGKTSLRELIGLIHHAEGVICGVTAAMHIAAALNKPCVVLGGGREAWWWEAYVNQNTGFGPLAAGKLKTPHKYLHTIGLLDCCATHGCWKNKVVPLNNDRLLCKYPVIKPYQPVPKCLDLIHVDHVMEAVMEYYTDGTLPPITPKLGEDKQLPPIQLTRATGTRMPQGRSPRAARTIARSTRPGGASPPIAENFDSPDVGGKFTVFILMYGEYYDLHRRCLEGIITTTDPERIDIRIGSNAVNDQSLALIDSHLATGRVSKHYRHRGNDYKYPVMREMFFDPAHPVTTKWVIWFDDDSIVRDPQWLKALAGSINSYHQRDNAHMFGAIMRHTLGSHQKAIFAGRPWYLKKQWRLPNGKPAGHGSETMFCTGGWWALTYEAIVKAHIPDLGTGLTHNGGDWQIGEQLYQAGFKMKSFNGGKQFIHTSSVPRRGVTMIAPGEARPNPPKPRQPRQVILR